MRNKISKTTVMLVISVLTVFSLISDKSNKILVNLTSTFHDNTHGVKVSSSEHSRKLSAPLSERKKKIKGLVKKDSPDLFAKYHHDIRKRHNESGTGYPTNYRIKELLKARSLETAKSLSKSRSNNQADWIERGPGNVSGRTRGLLVDPDDPEHNTWYAGSVGGGVWKTENAGQDWFELTTGLPNLATSALAMAPSNPDVIYAGTGEGFGNLDQIDGSGIWKTIDRGATWDQLASTADNPEFQNIMRIIVDPVDEDVLLVATAPGFYYLPGTRATSGIFRSTNGGDTWVKVHDAGAYNVEHIIANPENFNTQYATINSIGVIKSINGGLTWKAASNGIVGVQRMEIAIAPTDTSTLYISAQGGESGSILYISNDGGVDWLGARANNGFDIHWLAGQGWYDNTIAVHPFNESIIFVGGVNLWKLNVIAGIDTSEGQVSGIDFEETSSFLLLYNFGGALAGGGIDYGDADKSEYTSIEVRFGPGRSQKAHRFTVPSGMTNGVPEYRYSYQDYVDVPFELWDIENNVQLMVSFRDQTNNGEFELAEFNTNTTREYIFLHAVPYSETPVFGIARNAGHTFKQMYFIWPVLPADEIWQPNNLPEATVRIKWAHFTLTRRIATTNITDGYGWHGGSPKDVHVDHHNIVLVSTDAQTESFRLLNANDGGVAFSDNGGASFTQPLNGYNTTQFYGVDKKNGANEYFGGMQDNSTWRSPKGKNANARSQWTQQFGGDGFDCVWHYTDPNKLLGASQFNSIRRSVNGGGAWSNANSNSGLTDVGQSLAPFFTKIAKSKQDPDLVFTVGRSGVWRSDDFTQNWALTPMPDGWDGASSYSQVKISLVNPQIVWTGSNMLPGSPLYVSKDGGLSFVKTNVFSDVSLGVISGLETHPTDDSTAYALFSFARAPKILRTTDLGQTWEDISGFGTGSSSSSGFPDVAVYSLLVMPYDTSIIWAGTEIGLFESKDGGANWAYADNGLPATLIYEMLIVNDQVVVATHGRGVWSVTLPELAGYEPPVVLLSPMITQIGGGGNGIVHAEIALRSQYDSTVVIVDDEKMLKLPENRAALDTVIVLSVSVSEIATISVALTSYKNGKALSSKANDIIVYPLFAAQPSYSNEFNAATADFMNNGFVITRYSNFDNNAVHSPHNYWDNTTLKYMLKVPIIVASENAMIKYDDVAIIEPGATGTVFGDEEFWDYVILEGSKDNGANWIPLADGYDASYDEDWLTAYNKGNAGESVLFRTHTIDLLNTFSAGEEILIRFRLFADQNVNGWGWVIDNLFIQMAPTSVAKNEILPVIYSLSQNYPNPFNPTTRINYTLPRTTDVTLSIFNVLGQKVRSLLQNKQQSAGAYSILWDGANDLGRASSSGLYVYRLEAGDFVKSYKMMFMK